MPSQTIAFQQAHSCTLIITRCFQITFMNILFHLAQFMITPQDQQPLNTCFYPKLTLPQENALLNLLAQKNGLQYQTILNFQLLLPLHGNLRNTSYMTKITNYELSQHLTCPDQNTVYSSILHSVYFLCISTFSYFLCAHSMLFGMKIHFLFFSVLLCFSFIPHYLVFVTFLLFLMLFFNFFVLLKIF